MVAMANLNLPDRAVRQQIVGGMDMVIQLSRLSDGTRKIVSISEITGAEGDVIAMQDIFVFDRQGIGPGGEVLGRFRPTGVRPKFAETLKARGVELDAGAFLDTGGKSGGRGKSRSKGWGS
jgi:pilus assembly protein CpaF